MTYDDDVDSLMMSLKQAEEWLAAVDAGVKEELWPSVTINLGRVLEALGKSSFYLGHLMAGLEIKRKNEVSK
jgi:hypothetical protein